MGRFHAIHLVDFTKRYPVCASYVSVTGNTMTSIGHVGECRSHHQISVKGKLNYLFSEQTDDESSLMILIVNESK